MSGDGKNNNSEERMRRMPGLSIRKRLARRVSTVVPEVVEKFVLAKRFFADIERMQFEVFSNRYHLYEFTNRTYYHGRALQFLELGVFEGESIERWATINSDPESRFHGFDSFEGLPEDWGVLPKGILIWVEMCRGPATRASRFIRAGSKIRCPGLSLQYVRRLRC